MNELANRRFFVITFVVDEVVPDGQQPRSINVPAFVADWQTAADKAKEYIEHFADQPEARQLKEGKLKLQSIMLGGTMLI